jgi:arylsulfatase A-like enzyme
MLLRAALVAAAAATCSWAAPNFLVLLVDDTGAGDLNISGVPHDVPTITPNIYEMSRAPGAVVLPRFYIGGSVCSPTRASVLTGRTPSRDCVINVEENNLPYVLNMSTIGAVAQRAGYATAFYGKVGWGEYWQGSEGFAFVIGLWGKCGMSMLPCSGTSAR